MNQKNIPPFTLVSTVFNEARRLEATINDLKNQTLAPSEIIITDAGSTDGTYEQLLQWQKESAIPIKLLQKTKCNVAEGRNMAIRAARFDLIASTDFGCRFHPKWLESLMTPFANAEVKATAGAFTVKEEDLMTKPAKAAFLLFDGYRDNIHEPWFTPTSRSVAYYKELFEKVGGYCEWLTLAADDTIFGRLAKKQGYRFHMVDQPYVYWGRHSTAMGYAKEAFRYGLGDGESGINLRSTISNLIELVLRYSFFLYAIVAVLLIATNTIQSWWLLALVPLAAGFRSYVRYFKIWLRLRSDNYNIPVFIYGFYLLELTRIYYLKGYFKGRYRSTEKVKQESEKLRMRFSA